jgi:diketogulonate reductase-like aldo/keto reductase
VAVVAYTPFGQNSFPRPNTAGGKALSEVADAQGATPRQIALAFLTRRRSLFAIPKASKPGHVEENAGAGDIELSDAEIQQIDAAFPLGPRGRSLPMI